MHTKKPNNLLSPLVIAGITIGFLGAAYKFIFVDSKRSEKQQPQRQADSAEAIHPESHIE